MTKKPLTIEAGMKAHKRKLLRLKSKFEEKVEDQGFQPELVAEWHEIKQQIKAYNLARRLDGAPRAELIDKDLTL